MRNNRRSIKFHPIGYVENKFSKTSGWEQSEPGDSLIILNPELLSGLKGFLPEQRVMVLFYFDRIHDYDLQQHPRGDPSRPKRGVFTLRSPRRPNPIGLTEVEILAIEENVLRVRGLDAFNGTPVIDLKPA
jgi:tRNA-Thr(GGU) m(6)t(6)A37 methyltransferase TsaA